MASLFRPITTTYRTPDGKKCSKGTPAASKVRIRAKNWYGRYFNATGKRVTVPLCANHRDAETMLNKLVTDAKLIGAGLADPVVEEARGKLLVDHLDDYRRALEAKRDCGKHVAMTVSRIRTILDGCGFLGLNDLAADKVAEFLHTLRADPERPTLGDGKEWFSGGEMIQALGMRPPQLARLLKREKLAYKGEGKARQYPRATVEALQDLCLRGLGTSTSNAYLTALRGFSRWLVRHRRILTDPLAHMQRLNAEPDIRRRRRAFEADELRAILEAARQSPTCFRGLTGPDRFALYLVAMTTGYRAGELASTSPGSFNLDENPPMARVHAGYTKNKREASQPLPADVAGFLRGYLKSRPEGRVWPGTWHQTAAEMLRVDLDTAGIPFRDLEGRVGDFHSLRHSYVSLLGRMRVSPKVAQTLARHSDVRLTLGVYTHTGIFDLAGAVDSMPSLIAQPKQQAATGTDDAAGIRDSQGGLVCTRFVPISASEGLRGASPNSSMHHKDGAGPSSQDGGGEGTRSDSKLLAAGRREAGELGFEPCKRRIRRKLDSTGLTHNILLKLDLSQCRQRFDSASTWQFLLPLCYHLKPFCPLCHMGRFVTQSGNRVVAGLLPLVRETC